VIRERIGRTALRAYPPESRASRGEEMLGTLFDAGQRSVAAFCRESGSLVLAGLRERATITANVGTRRLIADGCNQAIAVLIVWLLRNGVLAETRYPAAASVRSTVALVVLGILLVCTVIGYDRWAGVCGFVLTVGLLLLADPHAPLRTRSVTLAITVVPIICFAVMALAPRMSRPNPRRLLWLAPAAAVAAILPSSQAGGLAFLAVISLAALIRLPADPRLAFACGLAWAAVGLSDVTVALAFANDDSRVWIPTALGATVMLATAATRLHSIQPKPQT
jgi:hypothetical protein